MALTDEQKLNVVRAKFTQKLNSYGDWTVFHEDKDQKLHQDGDLRRGRCPHRTI